MTGLDRCNNGNDLRSPTIAVDDLNADHIYVAFASNTSNTATEVNENVTVVDSLSAGAGWGGPGGVSQVNSSIVGRRYMPWVCSVGGSAYVSWYDRRNASAPTNLDLTDFYAGVAGLDPSGDLAAFGEFQINAPGTSDPNCAPGWACGSRALGDSAACAGTQLAGQCQGGATPTFAACDLTVAQPAGARRHRARSAPPGKR